MADVNIPSVVDTVTVAEDKPVTLSTMSVNPSINDAIGVADVVSTAPAFTLKLYRGTNSITVSKIDGDWSLTTAYKQFANVGVPLKGIILMPGSGTDVFVIKDGGETGSYLYKASHATGTNAVVVYPGSLCKPFIDFSECTLSAGHMITFVW